MVKSYNLSCFLDVPFKRGMTKKHIINTLRKTYHLKSDKLIGDKVLRFKNNQPLSYEKEEFEIVRDMLSKYKIYDGDISSFGAYVNTRYDITDGYDDNVIKLTFSQIWSK